MKEESEEECGFTLPLELGRGSYGTVRKAINPEFIGAMKTFKQSLKSQGLPGLIELDIGTRLRHPHLAPVLQFFTRLSCPDLKEHLALIMLLFDGTLKDVIRQFPNDPPHEQSRKLFQLVDALSFLHSSGILHLDIKLENIFYEKTTKGHDYFLGDFGLALYVDDPTENRLSFLHGTVTYRAPEIFMGSEFYSEKFDVWSLGIVFLELLSGRFIYELLDIQDFNENTVFTSLYEVFSESQRKNSFLQTVLPPSNAFYISLLDRMLEFYPDRRYSINQVRNHPPFNTLPSQKGYWNENPRTMYTSPLPIYREIVDILVNYIRSSFKGSYIELLFLAVDLYYQGLLFSSGHDKKSLLLIALTSLWIALKLLEDPFFDIENIANEFGIDLNYFLKAESILVEGLHGILYRRYLYHTCQTLDDLLNAYPLLFEYEYYLILDLPRWYKIISQQRPRYRHSKTITIQKFFKLLAHN